MQFSSLVMIVALTMLNLGLIWLLLAIPLGARTVTRTMHTSAARGRVWSALYPFGANASWNGTIISSELEPGTQKFGKIRISYDDRYGEPIERKVCLEELTPEVSYRLRIVDDTTLDPAFWQHYHERVSIAETDTGCAVTVSETDRYRGFAFLGFRYFKIRRQLMGLKIWAESGKYRDIGMFERPLTQVGMAFISAMILWPFFGLTPTGLILSSMLTLVVAMHEFGHMFAFRLMGHKSARMIFIPILGGIALGGRPYDRHFEVGFSALLGAGFSVFPVMAAISFYPVAVSHGWNGLAACLAAFGMIGAVFNLANLVPVWKFDGGQVIRQVFTNKWAQALSSFVLLGALLMIGMLAGFSVSVLLPVGVVFALMSLMTNGPSFKPRHALKPMTGRERAAILAGLAATFIAHASGTIWGLAQFS